MMCVFGTWFVYVLGFECDMLLRRQELKYLSNWVFEVFRDLVVRFV